MRGMTRPHLLNHGHQDAMCLAIDHLGRDTSHGSLASTSIVGAPEPVLAMESLPTPVATVTRRNHDSPGQTV